ncbi:MAG: hypothetical protein E6929_19000 [Clostridium sp.]|nr:hypothetical protein [Clostridium sp.]
MNKKDINFISCSVIVILLCQMLYSSIDSAKNVKYTLDNNNEISSPKSINSLTVQQKTKICNNEYVELNHIVTENIIDEKIAESTLHLPEYFKYKSINIDALKSFLSTRSSILKDDPYFSSILNVSKKFNINPILLFAITGQEQGFVPEEQVSAVLIANNPYNVFCSWEAYNTDITDSSEIACRTIINLSKDRPESVDPLVWVNRKYSSDQNWHSGVRTLYNEIVDFINDYEK